MQESRSRGSEYFPVPSSETSPNAGPGSTVPSPRNLPSARPSLGGENASGTPLPLPLPTLPSLMRSRSMTPGDGGSSEAGSRRSFVHTMLNPPQGYGEEQLPHSLPASRMDSPISAQTSPNSLMTLISRPPSTDTGTAGNDSPLKAQYGRDPFARQILTPRSPGLHRAASTGRLGQPTGTISALESPFLHEGNRRYITESGPTRVPALQTLAGQRQQAGFVYDTAPTTSKPSLKRRVSRGLQQEDNTSPRTPFANHAQSVHPGQASPGPSFGSAPSSAPRGFVVPPGAVLSAHSSRPVSYEPERPFGGVAHTGQTVIQMMAVETGQGIVQVPVDVQAASRVADEKRKRNAGASARFRQRRKEKEAQASNTISRLEQQVRDAEEDVEFYKRERDTLASILLHNGYDRHLPRPVSPRHRRPSAPAASSNAEQHPTSGSTSSSAYAAMSPDRSPPAESDLNKRRRTSGYFLPEASNIPTTTSMPSLTPTSFPPMMPTIAQPHSASDFGQRGMPNTMPPHNAAHTLPRLQEPYRDERYHRNWPAEPGNPERRGA